MGSPSKGCLETPRLRRGLQHLPLQHLCCSELPIKGDYFARLALLQTEKEQNSSSLLLGLAQVVQAALDWGLVELIM